MFTLPEAGVPESAPDIVLKLTPTGSVPVSDSVGVGVPVAVTVNVPAVPTVNVVALAEVICGATGVDVGVTITVPEENGPGPIALLALTMQLYVTALVRPETVTGEAPPLPVSGPGVQLAV